jgi:hypothetical protein
VEVQGERSSIRHGLFSFQKRNHALKREQQKKKKKQKNEQQKNSVKIGRVGRVDDRPKF